LNAPLTHIDLYGLLEQKKEDLGLSNHLKESLRPSASKDKKTLNYPIFEDGKIPLQRGEIAFVNGICTDDYEARQHAKMLSDYSGGFIVKTAYNATGGALRDIGESITGMFGAQSGPVQNIRDMIQNFHQTRPPDAKMLWIAHSQGAMHLHNALATLHSNEQKRCIVLGIAPAKIITRQICFDTKSFMSLRDIVPLFDLSGKAGQRGLQLIGHTDDPFDLEVQRAFAASSPFLYLKILSPHRDAPLFDHSIASPTFQSTLQDFIQNYIESEEQR
jgi:hypothetical protein